MLQAANVELPRRTSQKLVLPKFTALFEIINKARKQHMIQEIKEISTQKTHATAQTPEALRIFQLEQKATQNYALYTLEEALVITPEQDQKFQEKQPEHN